MVKFEFDLNKARKALSEISDGSTRVVGNATPRTPDLVVPGMSTGKTPVKQEPARAVEAKKPRSDDIADIKEDIRDLKARIRRLETEYDDGK